jgi:hypothetical protein
MKKMLYIKLQCNTNTRALEEKLYEMHEKFILFHTLWNESKF